MKNTRKSLLFLPLVAVLLSGCVSKGGHKGGGGGGSSDPNKGYIDGREIYTNGKVKGTKYVFEIPEGDYYDGCADLSGNNLLSKLNSINSAKHTKTITYSQTKYNACYTDNHGKDGSFFTFYDAIECVVGTEDAKDSSGEYKYNREHVWPKSHGGNLVENDVHMIRIAGADENGSRGNAFYNLPSDGKYDPGCLTADNSYRGDAARIIFYCLIADTKLQPSDLTSHATSNANPDYLMGRISTLLKWNLEYPVKDRELFRNSGAMYLQGNRNPFIDHPEYGCKIWGSYNDVTRSVCKGKF